MESFQDIEHFVKTLSAAIKKKIPTKVSQLTNDAGYKTTDTTYKLSKTGSTVTLTGSDGSTTSVTDDNATYSSLKNPYSLDIQNNGTTVASYDGSTAKTANFTNATSSADGLMSKTDKARLDDIAYSAEGIIDQIVNLTAEEWTGDEAPYSQTVNVTGMTSELLCELFSACSKSATVAERKAYNKAYAIVASGYAETADGSVMFYVNEKPSIDIAVRIKSIPKANVVSDQTSITDLQSKLTSLNADLAKCFFINDVGTVNNIYHYGINSNVGHSTTLTIDFGDTNYNCMTALIFTRYGLSGLWINTTENGQVAPPSISNIVGYNSFSATYSGNKVTLTIDAWVIFEMLFVMNANNILPTFTVS